MVDQISDKDKKDSELKCFIELSFYVFFEFL
jgi:hypothetical protein